MRQLPAMHAHSGIYSGKVSNVMTHVIKNLGGLGILGQG